jgi:hypothetical protein
VAIIRDLAIGLSAAENQIEWKRTRRIHKKATAPLSKSHGDRLIHRNRHCADLQE